MNLITLDQSNRGRPPLWNAFGWALIFLLGAQTVNDISPELGSVALAQSKEMAQPFQIQESQFPIQGSLARLGAGSELQFLGQLTLNSDVSEFQGASSKGFAAFSIQGDVALYQRDPFFLEMSYSSLLSGAQMSAVFSSGKAVKLGVANENKVTVFDFNSEGLLPKEKAKEVLENESFKLELTSYSNACPKEMTCVVRVPSWALMHRIQNKTPSSSFGFPNQSFVVVASQKLAILDATSQKLWNLWDIRDLEDSLGLGTLKDVKSANGSRILLQYSKAGIILDFKKDRAYLVQNSGISVSKSPLAHLGKTAFEPWIDFHKPYGSGVKLGNLLHVSFDSLVFEAGVLVWKDSQETFEFTEFSAPVAKVVAGIGDGKASTSRGFRALSLQGAELKLYTYEISGNAKVKLLDTKSLMGFRGTLNQLLISFDSVYEVQFKKLNFLGKWGQSAPVSPVAVRLPEDAWVATPRWESGGDFFVRTKTADGKCTWRLMAPNVHQPKSFRNTPVEFSCTGFVHLSFEDGSTTLIHYENGVVTLKQIINSFQLRLEP